MYKIGFLIAILLIAPIILVQDVLSSDGYWAPDNVTWNIVNARDDVSTTWKNVSNMSVAGSTIWKWDTMDCTQKIVSNFSWRGIPEIMEQSKPYNLTAKLEQIECNENCLSVGS